MGKAAREWKLDRDLVFAHIVSQAEKLPDVAGSIEEAMASGGEVIGRLVEETITIDPYDVTIVIGIGGSPIPPRPIEVKLQAYCNLPKLTL